MAATESHPLAGLEPKKLDQYSPDLPEVLSLLHDSFAFMDGRIDPPSSLGRMTIATLVEHAQTQEIWAISSPPKACMFLTIHADHIYLGKLAVAPACRGQGLGNLLIDTAKARAQDLSLKKVRLEVRIELSENQKFLALLRFVE